MKGSYLDLCNEVKDGWEDNPLVEWIEKDPVKSPRISDREIAKETMKFSVLIQKDSYICCMEKLMI